MKRFIINEVKKKTSKWWKWLCRVFMIWYWPTNPLEVIDMTPVIADKLLLWDYYDWINLTIHYWSWTWRMVIEQQLREDFWDDVKIDDISIF